MNDFSLFAPSEIDEGKKSFPPSFFLRPVRIMLRAGRSAAALLAAARAEAGALASTSGSSGSAGGSSGSIFFLARSLASTPAPAPASDGIECTVNGKTVTIPKGSNVMAACDAAGVDIPRCGSESEERRATKAPSRRLKKEQSRARGSRAFPRSHVDALASSLLAVDGERFG